MIIGIHNSDLYKREYASAGILFPLFVKACFCRIRDRRIKAHQNGPKWTHSGLGSVLICSDLFRWSGFFLTFQIPGIVFSISSSTKLCIYNIYIYIFNILQTTKSLAGVFHLRNLREDSHCDSCYVSSGLKLPSNFLFHASQEILGHQSIGVSPKALTIHVTYDIFTYIHQHYVVFAIHIACIV